MPPTIGVQLPQLPPPRLPAPLQVFAASTKSRMLVYTAFLIASTRCTTNLNGTILQLMARLRTSMFASKLDRKYYHSRDAAGSIGARSSL